MTTDLDFTMSLNKISSPINCSQSGKSVLDSSSIAVAQVTKLNGIKFEEDSYDDFRWVNWQCLIINLGQRKKNQIGWLLIVFLFSFKPGSFILLVNFDWKRNQNQPIASSKLQTLQNFLYNFSLVKAEHVA